MSSQGALQEEAGGRGNVAMEAERLDDALLLDLKTEGGGHKPRTCKQLLDPEEARKQPVVGTSPVHTLTLPQ